MKSFFKNCRQFSHSLSSLLSIMLKGDLKHLLCHNDKLAKCYFHSYFYLKYYSQVNLFEHRDKTTLGIGCFR